MFFILFYIALVIIRPQEYPALVEQPPPILPVALVAAMIAWAISARKTFTEPQYPLLFGFLAAVMLSQVANGWAGGALAQLMLFGPAVATFVLLSHAVTTQRRVVAAMVTIVLCACVLAVHGVEQVETGIGWTGMPLVQDDGRIQYVGVFSDPNDLGLLFVSVLPMAFYLSTRGGLLGLARLFWLGAAGLLLYGIYLTNSRGALLAVAFIVGFWLWLRRGLVTALLVGGAGLAGMTLLPSRLQELDASESSAAGRIDAWYEGLQMFMSQPIFGVGAGNFTEHNYLTAHNSFVLALAETGFVGFTFWLAFVAYGFRMMLTLYRHQPELPDEDAAQRWKTERAIAGTLLLALAGFCAAAFFLSRTYNIVLYLVAALIVGEYHAARGRFPTLPEFPIGRDLVRIPLYAIAAIIALYVLVRVLL